MPDVLYVGLKKKICVPPLYSRGAASVFEPSAIFGAFQVRERNSMDYVIAGIASVGLFVYLIYALLRPEKF